jgi:hypothetical protein
MGLNYVLIVLGIGIAGKGFFMTKQSAKDDVMPDLFGLILEIFPWYVKKAFVILLGIGFVTLGVVKLVQASS